MSDVPPTPGGVQMHGSEMSMAGSSMAGSEKKRKRLGMPVDVLEGRMRKLEEKVVRRDTKIEMLRDQLEQVKKREVLLTDEVKRTRELAAESASQTSKQFLKMKNSLSATHERERMLRDQLDTMRSATASTSSIAPSPMSATYASAYSPISQHPSSLQQLERIKHLESQLADHRARSDVSLNQQAETIGSLTTQLDAANHLVADLKAALAKKQDTPSSSSQTPPLPAPAALPHNDEILAEFRSQVSETVYNIIAREGTKTDAFDYKAVILHLASRLERTSNASLNDYPSFNHNNSTLLDNHDKQGADGPEADDAESNNNNNTNNNNNNTNNTNSTTTSPPAPPSANHRAQDDDNDVDSPSPTPNDVAVQPAGRAGASTAAEEEQPATRPADATPQPPAAAPSADQPADATAGRDEEEEEDDDDDVFQIVDHSDAVDDPQNPVDVSAPAGDQDEPQLPHDGEYTAQEEEFDYRSYVHDNWIRIFHYEYNNFYYAHVTSGDTSWEQPGEFEISAAVLYEPPEAPADDWGTGGIEMGTADAEDGEDAGGDLGDGPGDRASPDVDQVPEEVEAVGWAVPEDVGTDTFAAETPAETTAETAAETTAETTTDATADAVAAEATADATADTLAAETTADTAADTFAAETAETTAPEIIAEETTTRDAADDLSSGVAVPALAGDVDDTDAAAPLPDTDRPASPPDVKEEMWPVHTAKRLAAVQAEIRELLPDGVTEEAFFGSYASIEEKQEEKFEAPIPDQSPGLNVPCISVDPFSSTGGEMNLAFTFDFK